MVLQQKGKKIKRFLILYAGEKGLLMHAFIYSVWNSQTFIRTPV
jgi:hypothetical protein